MPERLIMRVISVIDEMMMLLQTEQVGKNYKKVYYVNSVVERRWAKAPHRQITGHKDLLSSRDIQAMRTSIFPGDEVGASRPCEATCAQADGHGEATIWSHS